MSTILISQDEACKIEIGKFYTDGYDSLVYTFILNDEHYKSKPSDCLYDWDELVSIVAIKVHKYIDLDNRFDFRNIFTNITVHKETMQQVDMKYIWIPCQPRPNTIERFNFTSKQQMMSNILAFLLHMKVGNNG